MGVDGLVGTSREHVKACLNISVKRLENIISGFALNVHLTVTNRTHPRHHALIKVATIRDVSLAGFTALAWFVWDSSVTALVGGLEIVGHSFSFFVAR